MKHFLGSQEYSICFSFEINEKDLFDAAGHYYYQYILFLFIYFYRKWPLLTFICRKKARYENESYTVSCAVIFGKSDA